MLILTPSGYKLIQECSIGDAVVYFDVDTGERLITYIREIQEVNKSNYDVMVESGETTNGELISRRSIWSEEGKETVLEFYEQLPVYKKDTFDFYLINNQFRLFKNQSVWANNNVCHAQDLKVGDIIYDDNDQDIEITSIELIPDSDTDTFWRLKINLTSEVDDKGQFIDQTGDHSYIMDGLTLHNASKFWVPATTTGSGTVSQTAHWSATSNGAGGSTIPVSSDDVYFDQYSVTAAGQTIVISSTSSWKSVSMAGLLNTPTFSGSSSLIINGGNAVLIAAIGFTYTGTITLAAGANTLQLTTAGIPLNSLTITGSTGKVQLQDALNLRGSALTRSSGVFDANGQDVIITPVATTHVFTISGSFTAANSFFNLTRIDTEDKPGTLKFSAAMTITNLFTVMGASEINRILVASNSSATQRVITAASVSIDNADFSDIVGAGASDWDLSAKTTVGNCRNNSGITFPAQRIMYWSKNTGSLSDKNKLFSDTNGGGSAGRVPLPQDKVVFDSSSFDTGSQVITQNLLRLCAIDFSGASNTPEFAFSTDFTFYNDYVLGTINYSGIATMTFSGYGTKQIKTYGNVLNGIIAVDEATGGTLQLGDNLITNNSPFLISRGSVDFNDFDSSFASFSATSSTTKVYLGSGTMELSGNGTIFDPSTGSSIIVAETSTIKVTNTSASDKRMILRDYTYYNVWMAGGGKLHTAGSGDFNEIKCNPGTSLEPDGGNVLTVASMDMQGTAELPIQFSVYSGTIPSSLVCTSGTINFHYCDISYCNASGGATFDASDGTNSDGGNNTGFTWSVVAQTLVLLAQVGSFSLTGIDAIFRKALKTLSASVGAFTLTGIDINITRLRKLVASVGAFTLTGVNVNFIRLRKLVAQVGSYSLTGIDVILHKNLKPLVASVGLFTLTGINALFHKALKPLVALVGAFTLTGVNAGLLRPIRKMAVSVGEFVLTGVDVGLIKLLAGLSAGLISYWKLDNNSNDALGTNNGTNNFINYNTGLIGQAIEFNNNLSEAYVALPGEISFQTINYWVKKRGTGLAIFFGRSVNNYFLLCDLSKAGGWYGSTGVFVNWLDGNLDDNWHMITFIKTGTTSFNIYKDTVYQGEAAIPGFTSYLGNQIGHTSDHNKSQGFLDELGVWSRVLSADELTALYNLGSGNQYPFYRFMSMIVSVGAFTLTGINANFTRLRKLTTAVGAFTLTGVNVNFYRLRKLVTQVGAFTLTGIDSLMTRSRKLIAQVGAFTLTGIDTNFRKTLKMITETGSFILTGIDVNLIKSFLKSLIMSVEVGVFSLTGIDASFTRLRRMIAQTGTFTLTGIDINFKRLRKLIASVGTFTLTGAEVALHKNLKPLIASVGSFTLSGVNILIHRGKIMFTQVGAFTLTGVKAVLKVWHVIKWTKYPKSTDSTITRYQKSTDTTLNRYPKNTDSSWNKYDKEK